jgi:hypothetical protein
MADLGDAGRQIFKRHESHAIGCGKPSAIDRVEDRVRRTAVTDIRRTEDIKSIGDMSG